MTAPSPTPDAALTEVEGYADHTSCVESYTALLNRETALRQAAADLVEELDANARNLWHDAAGRAVNSAQVGAADQASRIAERVSRALLAQHATPSDPPQGEDVARCPECRHAPHGSVGFCPNMASDNDCACTYRDPAPAESRDAQSGVAEVLAEVLAEHQYREVRGDYEIAPYYRHFGCTCGWEQNIAGMSGWRSWVAAHVTHVAAMQAAALGPLLAAERAKALREAAEEIDRVGHHWSGAPALAFFALAGDLRDRADREQP